MDITKTRTRAIQERTSKVRVENFANVYQAGSGVKGLLGCLPTILAGNDFRKVVDAIVRARLGGKAIVWGVGAHVVKCGLNPILIDLMRRNFITALAMNGATAIHDFEVAMVGCTSEDVETELREGDFGTSQETGQWMNEAIRAGSDQERGMGEALGGYVQSHPEEFLHSSCSLLASAYSLRVPVTIHVAIGTDTIHYHPSAEGSSLGKASLLDFRLLASIVRELHGGGVFLNCGSAVILPEVFLKTVSLVRNLGYPLENFTTVNLDFLQHYRPVQNVVRRPTARSGQGICLTGHHEIMIPLLAAALVEYEHS